MNSFMRALAFLTIIPLPFVHFSSDGKELSASAAAFPLAGATIGLVLAGTGWLLTQVFPLPAVIVILLFLNFLLTRGLHFDGLADTADGLIGTTSREKAFQAMSDSAIGVMGAVVLLLVTLLKIFLLIETGVELLPLLLLLMPVAGRWSIVFSGAWFGPAREKGLGDLFLRGLSPLILLKASLAAVMIIALIIWFLPGLAFPVIVGMLAALLTSYLLSFYAARRLGGISGDILGAANEIGELLLLVGFYLAWQLLI